MKEQLKNTIIKITRKKISDVDVSHDIEHALRVLTNAERIAKKEKGDLDIIIPAALFHVLVVYPKDHPKKGQSQEKSAIAAEKILLKIKTFPKRKIKKVMECIRECSFSKGIIPQTIESKIVQDADGLEATGAISIMRTFSSTGQMKKSFYHSQDPFYKTNRKLDGINFALDLFYERLLKVTERMHTSEAKRIAKRRTNFLKKFLRELEMELVPERVPN